MKVLLDEHFDHVIAAQLSFRAVDAVAITRDRAHLVGQDDDVILRGATAEGRVVVTNNVRDFAPLVEDFGLRGEQHFQSAHRHADEHRRRRAEVIEERSDARRVSVEPVILRRRPIGPRECHRTGRNSLPMNHEFLDDPIQASASPVRCL